MKSPGCLVTRGEGAAYTHKGDLSQPGFIDCYTSDHGPDTLCGWWSCKNAEFSNFDINSKYVNIHHICLRSRPRDPDVVCSLVRSNVENSDRMTE